MSPVMISPASTALDTTRVVIPEELACNRSWACWTRFIAFVVFRSSLVSCCCAVPRVLFSRATLPAVMMMPVSCVAAVSSAGARGYMQVMPFWTRVIGDGDASKLFHMQTNLRFGCVILRHYLDIERGDLFMALGRYNGSRGRTEYPNLVFGARKAWEYKPVAPGA